MGMNFNRLRKNKDAVMRGAALFCCDHLPHCLLYGRRPVAEYDFQLSNIDPFFWQSIVEYLPINIICTVIINLIFRLYTSLWRFAALWN